MTDLELPQLQVGRYVDLLKRRKWRLIPAAMLGLAAGTLVAWLIPRYYEAKTIVRIQPRQGFAPGPRQDPFLEEIRKARIVVKSEVIVTAAVRDLEWTGPYEDETDNRFRAFIADVRNRLTVRDHDTGRPQRSSALLEISFRDRDGDKAADMANAIRDLYLSREHAAIVASERRQLSLLTTEASKALQAWQDAVRDRVAWLNSSGIDPTAVNEEGRPVDQLRSKEAAQLEGEIRALDAAIAGLQVKIAASRSQLKGTKKEFDRDPATDPEISKLFTSIDAQIQATYDLLQAWRPSRPDYAQKKRELDALQARKKAWIEELGKQGYLKAPNPEYTRIKAELDSAGTELKAKEAIRSSKADRLSALRVWLKALPKAQAELQKLNQRVEVTYEEYKTKRAQETRQANKLSSIEVNRDSIIETIATAYPPPAPTYPNKMLVAVLGAAIGLGVAIGLIFLLDVLQPSFKSFDEVARGLPIPTLGGVSFLDLEEDIRAARARRMRITVVVVLMVGLVVTIVALYFLDPVRLPDWLRRFLDKILPVGG